MNFENMLQVRAKDLDSNNQIIYEIIDNTELAQNFTIDALTGIIMPAYPMDFESIDMDEMPLSGVIRPIYLRILARDDGIPSMSSNVSVIVYLHDINDNAPQFERDFYAVSILENTEGGTSITRVTHSYSNIENIEISIFSYHLIFFLIFRFSLTTRMVLHQTIKLRIVFRKVLPINLLSRQQLVSYP